VYVPGAQDLIQAGQWGCTSSVTTGPSSLTISATGSGYNPVDPNGKASDADLAAQDAIYQYIAAACRANSNVRRC